MINIDPKKWGDSYWSILFMSAGSSQFTELVRNYASPGGLPCETCNNDFSRMIVDLPPESGGVSRTARIQLVCAWRNRVSSKLSKPQYPCNQAVATWTNANVVDMFTSGKAWIFLFNSASVCDDLRHRQVFRHNIHILARIIGEFATQEDVTVIHQVFNDATHLNRLLTCKNRESCVRFVWELMSECMQKQHDWPSIQAEYLTPASACTKTCSPQH